MQNSISDDPLSLARYFTYCVHQKRAGNYIVAYVNISGKTTYAKNKKEFDCLSKIVGKYSIDAKEYLKWSAYNRGIGLFNISRLVDICNFQAYAEHKKILEQHQKIRSWFLKSVNYIVEECLERNYCSCKEFLKNEISHNTLAERVLSGKISVYYLATIKNLKEIISKMDRTNQETFRTLVERKDKLNSDVQDAFMETSIQKVNPMKFTDEILLKKISENGYTINRT